MQVESLVCNNCGAPLTVSPSTNFVRCVHCGSQLAVTRTPDAAYTQVLKRIGDNTASISAELEAIRHQHEIEMLQHELEAASDEWLRQRRELLEKNRDGATSAPTVWKASVTLGLALAAVAVGLFAMDGPNYGLTSILMFAGLLLLPFAATSYINARKYSAAEQRYLRRRGEILARLERARQGR